MQENKRTTRQHSLESDDAPELDADFFHEADLYQGKRLVRRGRPKQAQTKQHVSLRLSPEVLAVFRSSGKGWQRRVDGALKVFLVEHPLEDADADFAIEPN